jgi:hypothetical protein
VNQAVSFGLLAVGGITLTKALTGASFSNVVKGHPGTISKTGDQLTVAGVGTTAANIATGSVAKVLAMAGALVGTPYNQAGHAAAINSTVAAVKQLGTDCSGEVSDLMGPNGLGIWSTSYATPDIPNAPGISAGKGTQITLWNNAAAGSAGHVWIEFDLAGGIKRYFEEAGGVGSHEMTASEAANYIASGQYQPYHPTGY